MGAAQGSGEFEAFVLTVEPRLRRRLIGCRGVDVAQEAVAEALAYAWVALARGPGVDQPGGLPLPGRAVPHTPSRPAAASGTRGVAAPRRGARAHPRAAQLPNGNGAQCGWSTRWRMDLRRSQRSAGDQRVRGRRPRRSCGSNGCAAAWRLRPVLDVIEQLQRYGDAVTETVDAVRPDTIGSVATAIETRRRRPVWQPLLGPAAVVALLVGGYWLASSASDSAPPAAPRTVVHSPAQLRRVDHDPRPDRDRSAPGDPAARRGPAHAPGRRRSHVDGHRARRPGGVIPPANQGHEGVGDGAAYNPSTHQWQMMADEPLPTSRDTRQAVSTEASSSCGPGVGPEPDRELGRSW